MFMVLWDYDKRTLKKSKQGQILLLERLINYGPGTEKIKLSEVEKYWNELKLWPERKRFFELLLWKK